VQELKSGVENECIAETLVLTATMYLTPPIYQSLVVIACFTTPILFILTKNCQFSYEKAGGSIKNKYITFSL
jgi:hypothetical protein